MNKETIDKVLEDFCKAYIAETGCNPSEVELVEERRQLEVVFYFRKKETR